MDLAGENGAHTTADRQVPSAYLHLPFCDYHCGYCHFTVEAGRDYLIDEYLRALEIELSWLKEARRVETVFVGGGTPTYLSPLQLERLLNLVRKSFVFGDRYEWTLEANPSDLCEEKLALLSEYGVNRLSLGVQSFDDEKLALLERNHNSDLVEKGVALAKKYVPNISLDLIFATPNESLQTWQNDLRRAVALSPLHLSTYGLTFEKGTAFWGRRERKELTETAEDLFIEMYLEARHFLKDRGYTHYEISNFAQNQKKCFHNIRCWQGEEYYAIGAGACGYLDSVRYTNNRSTRGYMKAVLEGKDPIVSKEIISPIDRIIEKIVFGLRRLDGLEITPLFAELEKCSNGQPVEVNGAKVRKRLEPLLERYRHLGWLQESFGKLSFTEEGILVSDTLLAEMLAAGTAG
ncbi:MAG: radical SAM family heme chaperone HemW [Pirellulaceae bacterium]|nr:radical SAM family heme chaperone HemW [Pirellulaceae bacterium]